MNLFEAINAGNLEEVNRIIATGGDVNEKNPMTDWPLLIHAIFAENRNPDIVNCLIQNGADVNKKIPLSGSSPLMFALLFANKNPDIVNCLIKNGANVNEPDLAGLTPFLKALELKDLKLVRSFVENGGYLGPHKIWSDQTVDSRRLKDSDENINNYLKATFQVLSNLDVEIILNP